MWVSSVKTSNESTLEAFGILDIDTFPVRVAYYRHGVHFNLDFLKMILAIFKEEAIDDRIKRKSHETI
jgi:hypothetical protein